MSKTFGDDLVAKTKDAKIHACKARLDQAVKAAEDLESSVRWLTKERAWETLGYANFSEMWEAHSGFKCPTYVQALVIDQLIVEGLVPVKGKAAKVRGELTSGAIAEMVGLPANNGRSWIAGRIIIQLRNGVLPSEVVKADRSRNHPRRHGAGPDELVGESFHLLRRDADEVLEIARKADVPKAEIYRQAVAEYLMRHRDSR